MKKYILLSMLFFICNVYLQGQTTSDQSKYEYQPFIMDGTCNWFTVLYGYRNTVISNEDTVIQSKAYKKIYQQMCQSGETKYYGAIREENKRVFAVYEADKEGSEVLLYDFNLKVGDKISYGYPGKIDLEVARIDEVEIEGVNRRRYYFYDKETNPDEIYPFDSWIEGIGSEQDLLKPFYPLCACIGGNSRVRCVYRGERTLYKENMDDPCVCSQAQSVREYSKNRAFQVQRNPVENKRLILLLTEANFYKVDIYSYDGLLVKTRNINSENGTVEISLEGSEAGKYIAVLSCKDGSRESVQIIVKE